jgi:HSP20 family protein
MLTPMFPNELRHTLDHFRRTVDQMFDQSWNTPTTQTGNSEWTFSPVLESAWNDQNLHLRAILPGVQQSDLKVTLNSNQLVIEGERKRPEGWQQDSAFTQLAYGKFRTSVTLPNGLDVEQLQCRLHDGVLDIRIPMSEARKPRQIQIQTGEEAKTISAAKH